MPQLSWAITLNVTVPELNKLSGIWHGELVKVAQVVPLAIIVILVMAPLAEDAEAAKVTVAGAAVVELLLGLVMVTTGGGLARTGSVMAYLPQR